MVLSVMQAIYELYLAEPLEDLYRSVGSSNRSMMLLPVFFQAIMNETAYMNNHFETHRKIEKTFAIEDIRDFVAENAMPIPDAIHPYNKDSWACVDGRVRQGGRFAGPGGALGIEFALFAGIEQLEKDTGIEILVPEEDISREVEAFFGGMSCHTDTRAKHAGKTLHCAGCGHCNGALQNPDQYGLQKYAPYLQEYVEHLTIHPEVLDGEHREQAVIIISRAKSREQAFSLPGTGVDGGQAFICHWDDYLETLASLAERVATGVMAQQTSSEALKESAQKSAERQLSTTLDRLAKGLPRFSVFQTPKGVEVVMI